MVLNNPCTRYRPTVSPAKNSLVYFISIAYIDLPVLRGHGQEAKRGEAGGPRITRNCAALGSFLLTCATTELSLIAMWRLIGATPRGQPWTPAVTLPQGCDGLSARRMAVLWTFREPSLCRHVPHELMRNAVLNLTLITLQRHLPIKHFISIGYSAFVSSILTVFIAATHYISIS